MPVQVDRLRSLESAAAERVPPWEQFRYSLWTQFVNWGRQAAPEMVRESTMNSCWPLFSLRGVGFIRH